MAKKAPSTAGEGVRNRWFGRGFSRTLLSDGFPPALSCLLVYVTLHVLLHFFFWNTRSMVFCAQWPALFGIRLGCLAVVINLLFIIWIILDMSLPTSPSMARSRTTWRGCYLMGLVLLLGIQLYLESWREVIEYSSR